MTEQFENFFTLPLLEEDTQGRVAIRWLPDPQLQRHLNKLLRQQPQLSEAALIEMLLNSLRQNPDETLVTKHLRAFLARFSVQTAWRVLNDLKTLNRVPSDETALFKDLFQTALEAALTPTVFFKNFDFDRQRNAFWYSSLNKYIREKMGGLVTDKVREMSGMETYKRTDLGLASRSSEKRVVDALQYAGENSSQLPQYILAWQCFQEAKKANQINVAAPQPEQFQKIANRYNQLQEKLPINKQLVVNGTTLEAWLKKIGAAVRSYVDRRSESLDAPRYQGEEQTSSWVEQIVDESHSFEQETLSVSEIQTELKKFQEFLYDLLKNLESEAERIPLLMHGLSLSQAQVGIELQKDQSTIGRNYKKLLTKLLQQLALWAKEHQKIDLSSEALSNMKFYLPEQFEEYYSEVINEFFIEALNNFPVSSRHLFKLYYVRILDIVTIASELQISTVEVNGMLASNKQSLQESVALKIENRIQFSLKKPTGPAREKLIKLTEEWLKIAS